MSALEEWREWTKKPFDWDKDFPADWQSAQQHTEELAHNAINELLAEVERLKKEERGLRLDRHNLTKRAEAAEAKLALANDELRLGSDEVEDAQEQRDEARRERDRLAWMLKVKVASHCKYGERGPGGVERCDDCQATLADLAARYDARHEDGDG